METSTHTDDQHRYSDLTFETKILGEAKALSDPLRLSILHLLGTASYGVMELGRILNVSQSALSHHLKVLWQAGLVLTRKDANHIFYTRAPKEKDTDSFIENWGWLDKKTLPSSTLKHIALIEAERQKARIEHGCRFAKQVSIQQSWIAGAKDYQTLFWHRLDALNFSANEHVIEIGPGPGDLVKGLLSRFKKVTLIENNEAWIHQLTLHGKKESEQNSQLILMSEDALSACPAQADWVTFNLVLPHLPQPQSLIQRAAQWLKPGGRLMFTELCPHDQSWVRSHCEHKWLGFSSETLKLWAKEAGLIAHPFCYLSLRNGFQMQLGLFSAPFS